MVRICIVFLLSVKALLLFERLDLHSEFQTLLLPVLQTVSCCNCHGDLVTLANWTHLVYLNDDIGLGGSLAHGEGFVEIIFLLFRGPINWKMKGHNLLSGHVVHQLALVSAKPMPFARFLHSC